MNTVSCKREAQGNLGERIREGHVATEGEIRAMWPQAKEGLQLPEAGRGENQVLPQKLREDGSHPGTSILAQRCHV